jgi:hypothetical protein
MNRRFGGIGRRRTGSIGEVGRSHQAVQADPVLGPEMVNMSARRQSRYVRSSNVERYDENGSLRHVQSLPSRIIW